MNAVGCNDQIAEFELKMGLPMKTKLTGKRASRRREQTGHWLLQLPGLIGKEKCHRAARLWDADTQGKPQHYPNMNENSGKCAKF